MTSLITDVLTERAERAGSPDLDLDRLVADGEARARRTRITRVAGATGVGLLAAATVGAVVLTGLDGSPGRTTTGPGVAGTPSSGPAAPVPTSRMLSYASDDTVVVPQAGLELRAGERIASYAPVDDGFVWMAPEGTVSFLPSDGGAGTPIGLTEPSGGALRTEKDGSLAAWIDFSVTGGPELVVYDTAAGAEVLRTGENLDAGADAYRDSPNPAYVYAIDRGSVYWRNSAGAVRTDVATGRSEVLDPDAGGFTIGDVAAGQIASSASTTASAPGDARDASATRVAPGLGGGTVLPWSGNDHLSPDARFISFEDEDELVVADVASGREVGPTDQGYAYWVVTQWVDEDTAAVMAIDDLGDLDNPDGPDTAPLDLLTCDVSVDRAAACDVVVTADVDLNRFTLPVGETS